MAPLAAQQLLAIDHVLLGEALAAFDNVLCHPYGTASGLGTASSAGDAAGHAPCEALERELLAVVRGTDDCLRKPLLARWLLERHVAGSTAAGH